jgi:hypothetical protein
VVEKATRDGSHDLQIRGKVLPAHLIFVYI